MGVSVFDSDLLKDSWSTREMRELFCDQARVQRWLDVEAALAMVQARLGIIPAAAAAEIQKKAKYQNLDQAIVARESRITKHPLVPVIRALEHACCDGAGEFVHFGLTTQDVIDTGLVLQMKAAHQIILRDLKTMAASLYRLSQEHKNTPMMGRTLSLQALPVTFGFKTAIWLSEIDRHLQRLEEMAPRVFVGSIVGAVGTKASFGAGVGCLEQLVNDELHLGSANISWQSARDRFYEFGSVMGGVNATLNKIGNQILLLSHNEFDELAEPFGEGQVGSSTMPHKRNPAVTENSVTVSNTLKSNIAILSDIMKHEHERDGAVWKMEWKVIPEICLMLSVVLANLNFVLQGLTAKKEQMLANLHLLKGYVLAERIMMALSPKLGKQTAHEEVYRSAMRGIEGGIDFKQALLDNPAIANHVDEKELEQLLDPTTYIGAAPELVESLLAGVAAGGRLGNI